MNHYPLIVIPIKAFDLAKTRLGERLSPDHRSRLAQRLCERTLSFLARHFPEHDRLVVTASASIGDLAMAHGAQVLEEPGVDGLSQAASRAAAWARRHGYESQLLIPADIVQLDEQEIRRLLASFSGGPGVVICQANDGGTNALLTAPPDAMVFHFGLDSAAAHYAEARRRALPCRVLKLKNLSFDLDTPTDLSTLEALIQGNGSETLQELKTLWTPCMTPSEMAPRAAWRTTP
ncbi:2-phospho-L-lactate guanylyltransferase [Halomonas icarae]|uniref:3-phospho-D-glycerate guanylyltransferase n=1 Tax=Halomonas icarae TaxID=2691040 RepID=A0A7X4W1N1_9GAMM|nr:2-phospho-L-lactate guanylyltransferase [Halomonas icarae]MDR5903543.1 2-phospho-L-lactate guanylyltransferase [Halomonas icarae]NAW13363.1 2-phospho-L-lactate guanylyltransferase [Halomonas icarae]